MAKFNLKCFLLGHKFGGEPKAGETANCLRCGHDEKVVRIEVEASGEKWVVFESDEDNEEWLGRQF